VKGFSSLSLYRKNVRKMAGDKKMLLNGSELWIDALARLMTRWCIALGALSASAATESISSLSVPA